MSWPLSQDYNEAIQDPRTSFSDAELKSGEAVTNALGIPMPRSGNFADVYEIRCPSGSRWAVKCFTRQVYGLRERYSEIGKYLRRANLPFMVDFQYLEQGIRVRGQWYPVLKMQWVEGFVLNEFVRDNLDKKSILQALGQIWLRMAKRLRESYIAHCDLQHGNVMFVPGSNANSLAVKLIDYDGMCVPSLIGTKSGEVGHPAYQHPERLRTGAYDQEVDRFSLLSIAAALRCLAIGGRSLWERYDNGDNLLFRQADFQAPAESPLFKELLTIGDAPAQTLVKELHRACQGPLDGVPLLTDLMPDEKPSGKTKTPAISQQPTAAQGPDWDFGDKKAAEAVVKKRAGGKIPAWAWGAIGGAAAVLLLGAGVGVGLALRNGSTEKTETHVAQNKPETKTPNPPPKPPDENRPKPPADQVPQPLANNANNPPPQVNNPQPKPPEPAQAGEAAAKKRIFRLTPAGDMLAISDEGSKVWRLEEPRTQKLIREFHGHEGAVEAVAFSADGHRAVTSGADGMIRLWDVQTGEMIGTRKLFRKSAVVDVALSSDGKKAATVYGGPDADLWNFEDNSGGAYHNDRKAVSVAFSPDGRYLACGYDESDKAEDTILFLWPLFKNGNVLTFRGSPKAVRCIAFSPDGKYIAAGQSTPDSMVSVWEMATRRSVRQYRMAKSSIHRVAFSPDSRFLLASMENRYQVCQVEAEGRTVLGGGNIDQDLVTVAFTPDSGGVTFVYRKDDRATPAQMVRWPATGVAVNPPPAGAWEPPIDPDRDCKFEEDRGKLTITLPGMKVHDLEAESNRMNSPRLLRNVEGDFTAQVRVSGDFSAKSTEAAGLLLMVDEKTYVRLERSRIGASMSAIWQLHRDGKKAERPNNYPALPATEGHLRLERRGNKIVGSHSTDGENWTELKPFDVELPAKVKIGVCAVSVSEPFAPSFDQFRLKQGQGEMVRIDNWLTPARIVVQPPPGPMSQWDKPINPDNDCGFQDTVGKLTIRIPAKPHTLPAWGGQVNSPRMLRDVEGDFTAQVRVGGDFEPATDAAEGKQSWIGAGLLVWVDTNTFLRLERAGLHARKPSTLYTNWEIRQDGKEKKVGHNFPSLSGAETHLRLERRGKQILASYSEDGQKWTDVKPLDIELPAKVKIGVIAGSTTARTFTPTFDQFQLKKGQGAMVRIDNWLRPARVVVQPPPPPMRRSRRQPVPDAAAIEAAVKDIRARHKEEYTNNRNQLFSVLFNEINAARNDPPRHFALLRELRDISAENYVGSGLGQARSMARDFDVDPVEMQCDALETSMRSGRSQAGDIVEAGLPLVDQAVGLENYDIIARLVKDLRISATKGRLDATYSKTVESVLKRAENAKQEHDKLQADLRTLAANPDDAKANLAVGKFHCVARDNWEEGLPLLARGSDAALKALAEKDLANPDDPDEQIRLGGDWRKYATNSRSVKIACQKRAYHWYQIAAVQLKGTKLKNVQQSMASLAKAVPELQNLGWPFGVYFRPSPQPTADGYLPIRPPHSIVTRQYYRGAIDITVVARSMKTDLNILIGSGGRLIIGQQFNRNGDHLQVFRPDSAPEFFGSRAIDKAVTLPANRPFAIRWQVTPAGMKVWLEDQLLFEETRNYDLSSKYPVSIHCNSSPVEMKSVAIRRGPKK